MRFYSISSIFSELCRSVMFVKGRKLIKKLVEKGKCQIRPPTLTLEMMSVKHTDTFMIRGKIGYTALNLDALSCSNYSNFHPVKKNCAIIRQRRLIPGGEEWVFGGFKEVHDLLRWILFFQAPLCFVALSILRASGAEVLRVNLEWVRPFHCIRQRKAVGFSAPREK